MWHDPFRCFGPLFLTSPLSRPSCRPHWPEGFSDFSEVVHRVYESRPYLPFLLPSRPALAFTPNRGAECSLCACLFGGRGHPRCPSPSLRPSGGDRRLSSSHLAKKKGLDPSLESFSSDAAYLATSFFPFQLFFLYPVRSCLSHFLFHPQVSPSLSLFRIAGESVETPFSILFGWWEIYGNGFSPPHGELRRFPRILVEQIFLLLFFFQALPVRKWYDCPPIP